MILIRIFQKSYPQTARTLLVITPQRNLIIQVIPNKTSILLVDIIDLNSDRKKYL